MFHFKVCGVSFSIRRQFEEQSVATQTLRRSHAQVDACDKHYTHDWSNCLYAHPKESAARRDPRKFAYEPVACQWVKEVCQQRLQHWFKH